MLEVAGEEMSTLSMDHHGLVAAVCKDLKIAQKIDQRLGRDRQRVVSAGQAVVAMILNGLGFTNRRLYLTHQFFDGKPLSRLLDAEVEAKDITDYTLGHTLDEISEYGESQLFGEVAFDIALENKLLSQLNHLDTTSLSVEGAYATDPLSGQEGKQPRQEPGLLHITHGYSKDKRVDLKQAVLSLVANGPSNMPIWMEALDGNSSDKTSFHETIQKVHAFKQQIDLDTSSKWIADSALYSKDKLLKNSDYLWVTRVPETIKQARVLLEKPDEEFNWHDMEKGYRVSSIVSDYGEIKQRWLVVYSSQAYQREQKTLEKNLQKQANELEKALWHLSNERFCCEQDAKDALLAIEKRYPLYTIEETIVAQMKYPKKGKPKAEDEKVLVGYQAQTTWSKNEAAIKQALNKKGRFILATNDLDADAYPDQQLLADYKAQQHVESGFRFIKDPWFMVDSIFLKSPKRIQALMMVMTLCLLVYNVAQYKLRQSLKENKDTLPNQLGKQVTNPTMRWVFQLMEGIGIVQFFDQSRLPIKEIITNLNPLRKKIISHFGQTACWMYGLIQKNPNLGLGM